MKEYNASLIDETIYSPVLLVSCSVLFKLNEMLFLKQWWTSHFRSKHIYLKVSSKSPSMGVLVLLCDKNRIEKQCLKIKYPKIKIFVPCRISGSGKGKLEVQPRVEVWPQREYNVRQQSIPSVESYFCKLSPTNCPLYENLGGTS